MFELTPLPDAPSLSGRTLNGEQEWACIASSKARPVWLMTTHRWHWTRCAIYRRHARSTRHCRWRRCPGHQRAGPNLFRPLDPRWNRTLPEWPPSSELTSTKRPSESLPEQKKKGSRYTPISKRQDKPDAINWLLRNHPELTDAQIVRLIGTTKNTINAVRDRTHWNSSNLQLIDPVALGLCSQMELDALVAKANANKPTEPADEPGLAPIESQDMAQGDQPSDEPTAQSVFGTSNQ
jgi:Uncharacterized protein conserved in bacteria